MVHTPALGNCPRVPVSLTIPPQSRGVCGPLMSRQQAVGVSAADPREASVPGPRLPRPPGHRPGGAADRGVLLALLVTLGQVATWDQRQRQLRPQWPRRLGAGGVPVQSSQTLPGVLGGWRPPPEALCLGGRAQPCPAEPGLGGGPILSCQGGASAPQSTTTGFAVAFPLWEQVNLFLYLTVVKFCDL